MKYLMLIKHSEKYRTEEVPQALMDAMGPFVEAGFKKGIVKDTGGLKRTEFGHKIRLDGGKLKTIDGPFTEAKEIIGGYALMEFPSDAEAMENAREFMELHRKHWPEFEGECEVRPVQEIG